MSAAHPFRASRAVGGWAGAGLVAASIFSSAWTEFAVRTAASGGLVGSGELRLYRNSSSLLDFANRTRIG